VRVILLRAEGPAFCAGYGLDWSTAAQADEAKRIASGGRVWDSVGDYRMMKTFVDTYMKLWYAQKPTIAAVHGWCIAGGTDMVLCADMIVAAESASFGYPPSRVWGTPTTAMWVYPDGASSARSATC
jgi:enoyl-CoA hydratase